MLKNKNMLFILTLMMGTLISISANSWLGAWMGLEINLLSFIPLTIKLKNLLSTESALKYFLTQALASSILLFSVLVLSMNANFFGEFFFLWILNSSILMKMGAAPFHFWFPDMMEGLSWNMGFILMTWQKIAPMILISYCMMYSYNKLIILACIIIGSLGGLNQINLRKLMAYSSINHLGWLLSSLMISNYYWSLYFSFYTMISFSIVYMFNMMNFSLIKQLYSNNNSPIMKFLFFFNLLSLGGLPPFTGFLPKWVIIQALSINDIFMVTLMVMFTLITLFFYIRLTYSAFMINYTEISWIFFKNKFSLLILFFNFNSIMMLPFISLMYLIF